MQTWLCILDQDNFEIVKEMHVWGVSELHKKQLIKTKIGDLCAFYLIAGSPRRGATIGGIFEIISEPYIDQSDIFPSKRANLETYSHRIKLKAIKIFEPEKPFKPLIPALNFIKNKGKYGSYLHGRAMRKIPIEDIKLILNGNNR